MPDATELLKTLQKLDPTNDAHWTQNGQPNLAAVQELANDVTIKRKDITDAAPLLNRDAAIADKNAAAAPPPDPEPELDALAPVPLPPTNGFEEAQARNVELKELSKELELLREKRRQANVDFDVAQKKLDKLIEAGGFENETFDTTMAAYKAAQVHVRQGRANNRDVVKALKEAGIFNTAAPIDNAMARKNTRGANRPDYTPLVK